MSPADSFTAVNVAILSPAAASAKRKGAVRLALGATVSLTALKFAVGILSGSVSVLSEAMHSLLDLVSAAVAFYSVREAEKPADDDHPFGHGKFETLSSLFESLLLVLAGAWILHEAWNHYKDPHEIQHAYWAIATIVVSLVVSLVVFFQNKRAAEATESHAIRANALHFFADAVASLGVLIGLVLIEVTGWLVIDAVVAALVGLYVLVIAVQQSLHAVAELADNQIPANELERIRAILRKFQETHTAEAVEMHGLRTRKSGATRHIDFHLEVCGELTVKESHAICDQIEGELMNEFLSASVNIHVEPCDHHDANQCEGECPYKQKPRPRS